MERSRSGAWRKGTGASLTMKLLKESYEGTRLDILQTPIRKKKNLVSQLCFNQKKKKSENFNKYIKRLLRISESHSG